jgi:quercetin dioxygenase-like cupin family protein
VVALAATLAGCARSAPRVVLPALADGLEAFVAGHPLAPAESVRVDEVGRTAGASYHLVQIRGGETPHRHATHDLTGVVLRGRGMLTLGASRRPLAAGDAVVVPRGETHWFVAEGRGATVGLAVFTPPLDAPDHVPVAGR